MSQNNHPPRQAYMQTEIHTQPEYTRIFKAEPHTRAGTFNIDMKNPSVASETGPEKNRKNLEPHKPRAPHESSASRVIIRDPSLQPNNLSLLRAACLRLYNSLQPTNFPLSSPCSLTWGAGLHQRLAHLNAQLNAVVLHSLVVTHDRQQRLSHARRHTRFAEVRHTSKRIVVLSQHSRNTRPPPPPPQADEECVRKAGQTATCDAGGFSCI